MGSRRNILKLLAGYKKFRDKYFEPDNNYYQRLAEHGQSPKTLIVGCCDSRVDPAILASASPGELFVVRNVANLIPPFEKAGGYHGVSAALEFAVLNLKVENIVILGHRKCGGIRSLMLDQNEKEGFLYHWMNMARRAKDIVTAKFDGASEEELCHQCELESLRISLENIRTFPFVTKAENDGQLHIIGIYFDLEAGELWEFDEVKAGFSRVEV